MYSRFWIVRAKLYVVLLFVIVNASHLFGQSKSESRDFTELKLAAASDYKERDFDKALKGYMTALELAEKKNDLGNVADISLNIGNCHYYIRQQNTRLILKWWKGAFQTAKTIGLDSITAKAANNISVLFVEKNIIDSAEYYAKFARGFYIKTKNFANLASSLAILANVYTKNFSDHYKADSLLKIAERYADKSNNYTKKGYVSIVKSRLSFNQNKIRYAVRQADSAEQFYRKAKDWDGIRLSYSQRMVFLAKLGDPVAVDYAIKWQHMTDSVFKIENAAKIAEYEVRYQADKKEQENMILSQQVALKKLELKSRNQDFFMLLVVLLLIISIGFWFIYRLRYRNKQKELTLMADLQREREQIARDLHDSVGGQLSYILISLDGFNSLTKNVREELLQNITISARNVVSSLRETIWAISDEKIIASELFDKLKVYAKHMFSYSNTQIVFTEHIVIDKEMNALLGLNLFRICQEVLNNAFKYAIASQITLDLSTDATGKLKIDICDNGVGFVLDNCKDDTKHGICNIRTRASEQGILLKIDTKLGAGTKYFLVV
jgi:signal transduction histidine kinase